jgi:5-methyltetrahydropteroyltriglutamate--homocysteine methyltransferase
MAIPREPIGISPRPPSLIEAGRGCGPGHISKAELLSQHGCAVRDTIARFEAVGSKVITDGEQAKESFEVYPIHYLTSIAAGRIPIPFADDRHSLRLLTALAASGKHSKPKR